MRRLNVYRGQVISLVLKRDHSIGVQFHRLRDISREEIILQEGVLHRIERHTVGFAGHAKLLRESGRHLKRGLLLYGPPGTGKTMTAMHLAGRMKDRTVILLTGRGLGLVEQSVAMARVLQPATIILEDVDLIAEERQAAGQNSCNTILYELLNAMDGLADDADLLFILTTNRPDILEPALSARPGRVDLAVEIPVPDDQCRRRLLALYGEGLELEATDIGQVVRKTEGVSAAFIRELLRKSALVAADAGAGTKISDEHLSDALQELLVEGGPLTASLLGGKAN